MSYFRSHSNSPVFVAIAREVKANDVPQQLSNKETIGDMCLVDGREGALPQLLLPVDRQLRFSKLNGSKRRLPDMVAFTFSFPELLKYVKLDGRW